VRAPQVNAVEKEKSAAKKPMVEVMVKTPDEFVYSYDFDDNGALYWLGTYGKTRIWQNPHAIGQVRAFASSLGQGEAENFVGRVPTNT